MFKSMGVKLHFNTSYHPQTDGPMDRLRGSISAWKTT
jgi:hypothetical protein